MPKKTKPEPERVIQVIRFSHEEPYDLDVLTSRGRILGSHIYRQYYRRGRNRGKLKSIERVWTNYLLPERLPRFMKRDCILPPEG